VASAMAGLFRYLYIYTRYPSFSWVLPSTLDLLHPVRYSANINLMGIVVGMDLSPSATQRGSQQFTAFPVGESVFHRRLPC
jgi:hypothetical protein